MKPPRGIWLGATLVLHRSVPVAEPYPHVCHMPTGCNHPRPHRLRKIDCGACGDELHHQLVRAAALPTHPHRPDRDDGGCCPLPAQHPVHVLPELTDEQRAEKARRTGDH